MSKISHEVDYEADFYDLPAINKPATAQSIATYVGSDDRERSQTSHQQQPFAEAPGNIQSYSGGYSTGGAGRIVRRNDEGKIFVGGLNWETTEASLRGYFSDFGQVIDSVVMKDHMTGKSRGFGFITFQDPSVIEIVVSREHFLDGKRIDPKSASDPEPKDQSDKIFVGGIHADVSEDEFKDFFAVFGDVKEAHLMFDRETGRPRGFGFITFVSSQTAQEVLTKQGTLYIHNKLVEVKSAQPKQRDQKKNFQQARGQQQFPDQNYGMQNNMMYMNPMMMGANMYQMPVAAYAPFETYPSYTDPSQRKEVGDTTNAAPVDYTSGAAPAMPTVPAIDPAMMDAYMKMYAGFFGGYGMQGNQPPIPDMSQTQYDAQNTAPYQQLQAMPYLQYQYGQQPPVQSLRSSQYEKRGDGRRGDHRGHSKDRSYSREYKSRPRDERDIGYKTREERGEGGPTKGKNESKKSHPYAR